MRREQFSVLLAEDGLVIIDLPQAVDAAGNNHAHRMLLRGTFVREVGPVDVPELMGKVDDARAEEAVRVVRMGR